MRPKTEELRSRHINHLRTPHKLQCFPLSAGKSMHKVSLGQLSAVHEKLAFMSCAPETINATEEKGLCSLSFGSVYIIYS